MSDDALLRRAREAWEHIDRNEAGFAAPISLAAWAREYAAPLMDQAQQLDAGWVEAESRIAIATSQNEELFKAGCNLGVEIAELKARLARYEKVVEAARAWRDGGTGYGLIVAVTNLDAATSTGEEMSHADP